jgi:hypothetical protein
MAGELFIKFVLFVQHNINGMIKNMYICTCYCSVAQFITEIVEVN